MPSTNICTTCYLEDRCKEYGWAGTDHCNNYQPICDVSSMTFGTISTNKQCLIGDIYDLKSHTMEINNCKRIIFKDKTLDFVFELPETYFKDIDTIIVNDVKFKKVTK